MSNNNIFDGITDDDLRGAMQLKEQLPFTCPPLYWYNGQGVNKTIGGAAFFGGWQCPPEPFEQASSEFGFTPKGWAKATLTNREGDEFEAYLSRTVLIAVFGLRVRWFEDEESGAKRSSVQVLGWLASYEDKEKPFLPWGPVMLSGSGYSGKAITDALSAWGQVTGVVRREFAHGLSANLFYAPLGTFGQERKAKEVGGRKKSPITPCQVMEIKQPITYVQLERWYVGGAVQQKMAECRALAKDWLDEAGNGGKPNKQQPEYLEDEEPAW